jgi:cathepsin L
MRGPVSVAIDASSTAFQTYTSGIFTNSTACCPNCDVTSLNHAVTVVGFGLSPIPYYIVRNSWGSSWGDGGYINIAMQDGAGVCGIQLEVSYPNSLVSPAIDKFWLLFSTMLITTIVVVPATFILLKKHTQQDSAGSPHPGQTALKGVLWFEAIFFGICTVFYVLSCISSFTNY